MDYMKKLLNQINTEENSLYDIIYDLVFLSKFQKSEEEIKNGNYCTLEEFKKYMEELEVTHENRNIK